MKKKSKDSYIMSESELRTLKEDAQMNRHMIKQLDQEGYGAGNVASGIDKASILKQAKKLEDIAAAHVAPVVKGLDKDKLAKRANELRAQLSEGMCTGAEMNDIRKNPHAPRKNLEWERRNGAASNEYKQVMRRLEPQDPGAASIERFRK